MLDELVHDTKNIKLHWQAQITLEALRLVLAVDRILGMHSTAVNTLSDLRSTNIDAGWEA